MKKFLSIFAIMATFLTTTANAEIVVDADVSATTNLIHHGDTLSARGPSAGLGLTVKETGTGFFGKYNVNTVSVPQRNANLLHVADLGYGTSFRDVALGGGYRYYYFTGGNSALGNPNDLNHGELFLNASAFGVSGEYNRVINANLLGGAKSDSYARVAYSRQAFFKGLTPFVGLTRSHFQSTGYNGYGWDAGVDYAFNKNVNVGFTHVRASNVSSVGVRQNQNSVGITYKF